MKIGDRVKLITNYHEDDEYNPVWEGNSGCILGTIIKIEDVQYALVDYPVVVRWDNDNNNDYDWEDLEVVIEMTYVNLLLKIINPQQSQDCR